MDVVNILGICILILRNIIPGYFQIQQFLEGAWAWAGPHPAWIGPGQAWARPKLGLKPGGPSGRPALGGALIGNLDPGNLGTVHVRKAP